MKTAIWADLLHDDPDNYPFNNSDIEGPDETEGPAEYERDAYVDLAKEDLNGIFSENPKSVFYQRQLQVIFESKYFHWVTVRALAELVDERLVASEELPLPSGRIIFYRSPSYRYWKRAANEIVGLVSRFSTPEFAHALGAQGETMFDAALGWGGFTPKAKKVRVYREREWTGSGHDLDRVYERDGAEYGAEIKNTLSYIEKEELLFKLVMCKHLRLVPLFIVRMAPKNYVKLVAEHGGFTLIFKYQLYPFGQKGFADEVRARLRLPTDSPARIEDGTVKRLLDWHLKRLGRL